MTTWFDYKTLEVLARNYSLSYKAGMYDFDVSMKVEMTRVRGMLIPQIMRYKGNFGVLLKKREGENSPLHCLISGKRSDASKPTATYLFGRTLVKPSVSLRRTLERLAPSSANYRKAQ